jgi:hypothetical protein
LLANLPPIAVCAWGSLRLLPSDLPRHDLRLDLRGAALCLSAAACTLFAMLSGPTQGWLSPAVLSSAALAAGSLLCLWRWLGRAPKPLLDLSLFTQARWAKALLVIFLGYSAYSGVSFVLAQYLQLARAKAAFQAGLLTLPLAGSMLTGTLFAPRLMRRLRAERALSFSLCTALFGASLLAQASFVQSDLLLCCALLPFGAGCGSAFANATELTVGFVSHERAASAAAVSESAFEFGGVLGIAVTSTVLDSPSLAPASVSDHAPRALAVAAAAVLFALLVALSLSRSARAHATPSECSDP